jgi:hypothetical protein
MIDWARGDQQVQRRIEWLQAMDAPEVLIEAKRKSLGHVAYVSLEVSQFPGRSGWFYASSIERDLGDCLDLYSNPVADIPFLKHVSAEVASRIAFDYLLSTDSTWGLDIRAEPSQQDPYLFARRRLPERLYAELSLRPLSDWQAALARAVPQWLEKATFKSKGEMIERVGSVEAVATEVSSALAQIDAVQAAWTVLVPAPFHNSLLLQHRHWMSHTSLGGAPAGLLG